MKKDYRLWDVVEGELIEFDSPEQAKEFLIENYTEGDTCHPDMLDFELMEVKILEHPLKGLITK